jgi:hypothetical protein
MQTRGRQEAGNRQGPDKRQCKQQKADRRQDEIGRQEAGIFNLYQNNNAFLLIKGLTS